MSEPKGLESAPEASEWPLGTVTVLGALGDDLLGDIVITALARHGVDTAGLVRKNGAQTSGFLSGTQPAVAGRIKERTS
jgi:sugar/nucleoside kinase (ribokinase family)